MIETQENKKAKLPVHKYVPPYKTTIPSREEFHRCCGGSVYLGDFDTNLCNSMTNMASRIASDQRFDDFCQNYNSSIKEETINN